MEEFVLSGPLCSLVVQATDGFRGAANLLLEAFLAEEMDVRVQARLVGVVVAAELALVGPVLGVVRGFEFEVDLKKEIDRAPPEYLEPPSPVP